jgi:hypothetical protein
MKHLLLLLVIISCFDSFAKKAEIPFPVLIGESEFIIEGTIFSVSESQIEVIVKNRIKGIIEEKAIINIQVWKEWTCDFHRFDYKKDLELILFLNYSDELDQYSITHNSDGEFLVEADSIQVQSYKKISGEEFVKSLKLFVSKFTYVGDWYVDGIEKCFFKSTNNFTDNNGSEFYNWVIKSAEELNLFTEKWLFNLDLKSPRNVIRSIQYAAQSGDESVLDITIHPIEFVESSTNVAYSLWIMDSIGLEIIGNYDCDLEIKDWFERKKMFGADIYCQDQYISSVILEKQYENWFITQIRKKD